MALGNHMMRLTTLLGIALALEVKLASGVMAGTVGIIEGVAIDKDSKATLPGVNILVVGTSFGASTGPDGRFQIPNVPAGSYDISATIVGHRPLRLKEVRVVADLRTRLELRMEESPIEMGAVEVLAETPPILKDVTGTVHTVDQRQIELLPVSSFLGVVALQPGVTADLHVRGGKTTESLYLVDGLPIQDFITGEVGIDLPRSSIASMKVETGGYEAEYGNALSGVVSIVTPAGTNEHRVTGRIEKDDLFGGDEVDHRTEGELSAAGPIVPDALFYFASVSIVGSDTRYWQDLSQFFGSPVISGASGFAKLVYQWAPNMKLTGQFMGSTANWRDYEFSWRFNLAGLPERSKQSYRASTLFSHTVSPKLFYSATLSYYYGGSHIGPEQKSEVDTTMYQYDFFLRYVIGGNRALWAEYRQNITTLKADMTYQVGERHLLKAGGEFNYYSIYSDVLKLEPQKNVWGKPFLTKPMLNYSSDYRYYPYSASAYVQDKIELSHEGMLLNFGLRYDMLNPRAERPAVERIPVSEDEYQTVITDYVPATAKHLFSPRIGFSAPFAASGYLFVNYGEYVQFPLFDYLYSGLNNVSLQRGVGVLIGNPDLEPERTKAWEISAKYAFEDDAVLSATYFDKTTYNQIDIKTFVPGTARAAGDYGFAEFVNYQYARAQGLELMISRERHKLLTGSVSYTFMTVDGLSDDARQGLTYYQWGYPSPPKLYPLSWDQRHTVKFIANFALPWQTALSLLWAYSSGRPYTYYPTYDGFTPLDSTMRFTPNNARMPDVHLVDVKASKRFRLGDFGTLAFYVDIRNLLDTRNVVWMDSNGNVGGELSDVSAWGYPRRVRLGLRLEF